MSAAAPMNLEGPIGLKHMTLYQWFRAERDEILRHKWYESERRGYDIGFEAALIDWVLNHRAGWREAHMAGQHLIPPPSTE